MTQHPDHHAETPLHAHSPAPPHTHDPTAAHHHDPTELTPSDPYPFIFSYDAFDPRRVLASGEPYPPASNHVSRAATAFSIAVICGLLGLCALAFVLALVGR